MIKSFDSLYDFRLDCERVGFTKAGFWCEFADSWHGNESGTQTKQRMQTGDVNLVPAAEALLDKLDGEIETPRRVFERAPSGAFAIVPEAIAGFPTPMRRIVTTGDEKAPITVLASIAPSASVKASMFTKRGTVILALVMALARTRPVSLHVIDYGDGSRDNTGETVVSIRVNTDPLDLSTACYMLTSVGFVRRAIFSWQEVVNSYRGSWPRKFQPSYQKEYNDYLISKLALDPVNTLFIGAAHTVNEPMLARPLDWIKEQIAVFTGDAEHETVMET